MSTLSLAHLLISISLATFSWLLLRSGVPHLWPLMQRLTVRLGRHIGAWRTFLLDPTSHSARLATERAQIDLEYALFAIMKHALVSEEGADIKEYSRLLLIAQLRPKCALRSLFLSSFSPPFLSAKQISNILTTCIENDKVVAMASLELRTSHPNSDYTKEIHAFYRIIEQVRLGKQFIYVISKERICFKYIKPMLD